MDRDNDTDAIVAGPPPPGRGEDPQGATDADAAGAPESESDQNQLELVGRAVVGAGVAMPLAVLSARTGGRVSPLSAPEAEVLTASAPAFLSRVPLAKGAGSVLAGNEFLAAVATVALVRLGEYLLSSLQTGADKHAPADGPAPPAGERINAPEPPKPAGARSPANPPLPPTAL